jgi:cobalt-zinc-cadmium efflux system membrane fusion protein
MRKLTYICVLILCSLAMSACNGNTSNAPASEHSAQPTKGEIVLTPAQQAAGMIQTQTVVLSDAANTLRLTGRIALADDRIWRVGVRADGLVMAVYAGLGDFVQKGQVLARYHADEVREARAGYRKSLAELGRVQAAQALAQRNYDRAQTLLSLKAGSVQQVEQARQELLSAETQVRSAQIEVERGEDQLSDDLRVPADPPPGTPAEIADEVPILAPASGYVLEKNVTPGKTVQPSTDTYVIGDLSQVWMLASVRQEKLGQLHAGQSATVTLQGVPGQRFTGKLTNLGQQLDETTRVMQVRIVLNNPGNRLKPEMLADAEIPTGDRKPTLLLSSDAIQQIENQDIVFVQTAAGHFELRPVRVGETADGKTPILEGLKPGEQVVVHGSFTLKGQLLKSSMESE